MKSHHPWLLVSGAFAAGIGLQYYCALSFSALCFAALSFCVFSLAVRRNANALAAAIFFLFFSVGALYFQSRVMMRGDDLSKVFRYQRNKPVKMRGIIVSDVETKKSSYGPKTSFVFKVRAAEKNNKWIDRDGLLLVNLFREEDLFYGDELIITGRGHYPFNFKAPGRFSYRDYLRNRGIKWVCSLKKNSRVKLINRGKGNVVKACSLRVKRALKDKLSRYLTENESAIMQAVLLGSRGDLSGRIREIFVRTGTAHILAISGLHVGIITALFLVIVKIVPVGRVAHFIVTIILLIFYAFMVGARPSVVRATVMSVVFLSSLIAEREQDMLNTLMASAFFILLVNPFNLFDLGFQLSFACVLSIILLSPLIERGIKKLFRLQNDGKGGFFIRYTSCSLAVWLGVLGLIIYYFNIIVPVTILANLIAIPLIFIIVTLGFGLVIISFVIPPWAPLFALCVKLSLNILVGSLFLLTKIPFAYYYF